MSSEQQWPNQRKRGRDANFPPQSQPPEKQQKLETSGGRGAYEFAGAEAENLFPDPKTVLHNALQVHLKRMNKKLEFSVNRAYVPSLRRDVIRTFVKVPYPEAFTAHGEGNSKKEAERRCCAAACMKLLVSGWLANVCRISRTSAYLRIIEIVKCRIHACMRVCVCVCTRNPNLRLSIVLVLWTQLHDVLQV